MTNGSRPGGALSFLAPGGGQAPPARAVAFDVLDAQQQHVHQAFRAGFDRPRTLLEWMHAAGAVSLGFVDDDWFPRIFGDWWTVAGMLADPERRQQLTDHPPANPATLRERHIQHDLLPAFNSAIGLLRKKANEYEDHQVPDAPEGQRWLAMRPRLHQVTVAQHRALRQALGAPEAAPLEDRQDVTDWARRMVQVTTGAVSTDWLRRVTRPTGVWYDLLTGETGRAVLYALVADELLPPMNAALLEAAQRGAPDPEEASTDSGGPTRA